MKNGARVAGSEMNKRVENPSKESMADELN